MSSSIDIDCLLCSLFFVALYFSYLTCHHEAILTYLLCFFFFLLQFYVSYLIGRHESVSTHFIYCFSFIPLLHNIYYMSCRRESMLAFCYAYFLVKKIQYAAIQNENIFEYLMEATKYCSLGQITKSLFEVGGQYRRNM